MQQTLVWLKTWTAVWVLIALAAAFATGAVLRMLVRKSTIHASHALRVIESVSVIAGGAASHPARAVRQCLPRLPDRVGSKMAT
jgi:hypothetical protein